MEIIVPGDVITIKERKENATEDWKVTKVYRTKPQNVWLKAVSVNDEDRETQRIFWGPNGMKAFIGGDGLGNNPSSEIIAINGREL